MNAQQKRPPWVQRSLLVLTAALLMISPNAGASAQNDDSGGGEIAALCALIDCDAIAKRIARELEKEVLCIELSSKCQRRGVGRCKDIHGKMKSMNSSETWKHDFIRNTKSDRTRCYARSILERGGGNWEQFLKGIGIAPGHPYWDKYRKARGR